MSALFKNASYGYGYAWGDRFENRYVILYQRCFLGTMQKLLVIVMPHGRHNKHYYSSIINSVE